MLRIKMIIYDESETKIKIDQPLILYDIGVKGNPLEEAIDGVASLMKLAAKRQKEREGFISEDINI